MGLLHQAVERFKQRTNSKIVEYIKDPEGNGEAFAIIKFVNGRKGVLLVRDYLIRGTETGLNKKAVEMAIEKNWGLYLYIQRGDYSYEFTNPKMIQKFYKDKIDVFHSQKIFDLVDITLVGVKNIDETRRRTKNTPERFLTNLFVERNLPILFTGDNTTGFRIVNKIPDWKVEGQKKVVEFCGKYWHSKQEIEERKELFKLYGFETLIIWEGEENNVPKLLKKIKRFLVQGKEQKNLEDF